MLLRSFEDIHALAKQNATPKVVALAQAEDAHSLEAVLKVVEEGFLNAFYIGKREDIHAVAGQLGHEIDDARIIDAENRAAAAAKGVELVREGKADFLMKGHMETSELLKPVVNKEKGLYNGGVISHIAVNQIPNYHKLLITTDGGMLPYPTLEQKVSIINNAALLMNRLGNENPNVGVLCAVEKVNEKMPETVEASALKEMCASGVIKNCYVEGPISLDLALVKERAEIKGYSSPCAGEADILIVPNIHCGNILGKSLVEMAGAKMAGLVMGASCPIVLTSRGSSAEEKYNSLVLACAVS